VKSEVRVGRLRGSGANINITTATQVVGGLSVTLDIPKGHAAVVTLSAQIAANNSNNYAVLEIDGVQQAPSIYLSSPVGVSMPLTQTYIVTAGRRALRVLCYATANVGQLDPTQSTLAWVIAAQGGIAN